MTTTCVKLHTFTSQSLGLSLEENNLPILESHQCLIKVLAAPINPADLNILEGKYGMLPTLPAVIGNEGVGRVEQVGRNVRNLKVGDLVALLQPGTWTHHTVSSENEVVRLPSDSDVHQAAMFTVNPPTAYALLTSFLALQKGDWILQNAANSSVGRAVIQIARTHGIRTFNIVRHPGLIAELKALGGTEVLFDQADIPSAVKQCCGSNTSLPRLGLNAVGGAHALSLANAIANGGTLVTYGAMAKQPLKIPNGLLIFKDLTFRGFWLRHWIKTVPQQTLDEMWKFLIDCFLKPHSPSKDQNPPQIAPIEATYPLEQVEIAITHAKQENRTGKILLTM